MISKVRHLIPEPIVTLIKVLLGFTQPIQRMIFEVKLGQKTPILVYQMGKVGSSSIYSSLVKLYPGLVVHAHHFYKDHHRWDVRRLYQWAVVEKNPIHVITLTRSPIDRNVSAFFQNFEKCTGISYENIESVEEKIGQLFLDKYKHDIPLVWFDENIKENFGIDVYEKPFPTCGITSYEKNNVRLLVMRLEISDEEKVNAVNKFLNSQDFCLVNTNVGDAKIYADTYKKFKGKVRLPESYLNKMCASKYFNHFYSPDAIEASRVKWAE